jgi:hypothetical protein
MVAADFCLIINFNLRVIFAILLSRCAHHPKTLEHQIKVADV